MGQQPQLNSGASPWTNPAALADLLDYLRAQGFKITADEYAVAQDLVLALIARGEDINDIATLKTFLAPVLCKSPTQQMNFSAYFDRWRGRIERTEPLAAEREIETAGKRGRLWSWVLAALALVLGTTTVLLWPQPPAPPSPVTHYRYLPEQALRVDPVASLEIFISIALILGLLFFAWGVWWYLRGRLFLRRRATREEPDLIRIDLDSRLSEYFNDALLRRGARELRRRYTVPSSELAISLTLEQTIRNNGKFTPALRSRLAAPEYLVIIDRRNFKDHYARYVDELIDLLEAEQVHMERYYFDFDPRILRAVSSRQGPPTSLWDLTAKYRDFRVLLFSDCVGLFNSVSGELEAWADLPWGWHHFAVFTSNPPETWSYRERLLSERTMIMPATPRSILQFARKINGIPVAPEDLTYRTGPIPAELGARPKRWLERDAPEPRLLEDVLGSIRRFIGEDGYFWLSACAVYPAIYFNLTMYLGTNLKNAAGEPLFSFEQLASLFRLPWLRFAYMPDWLRLELVRRLSSEQNVMIREVLSRLWISVVAGSTKAIKLEIAHRHPHALANLTRSIFRRLARRSSVDSPLRDHVFTSVMLGQSLDPLAVRVPRMWREFLQRREAKNDEATQRVNSSRNAMWRAYQLLVTLATGMQSPLLLALRLYFFWQLFLIGKGKLENIGKVIEFFGSLGIPAPALNAYFVGALECFGGLLLIIGLASRPLALLIVISMSVAYLTADFEAVSSIFSDPDKFVKADPFPFLLTALIVLTFGPGLYSIDTVLKRWIAGVPFPRSDSSAGHPFRQTGMWRAYQLLVNFVNGMQSPLLLALRLYFFWQLFLTGKGKLENIGKVIEFFGHLRIPAPALNAYFVGALECFGGLLLIIGLASRPLALLIVISMSVAYVTADFEAVSSIFSDPDKFVKADPFPFLLTALIVLTFGPGLYSIDTVLKRWITGVPFVRSDSSAGHPFRQAGERQP